MAWRLERGATNDQGAARTVDDGSASALPLRSIRPDGGGDQGRAAFVGDAPTVAGTIPGHSCADQRERTAVENAPAVASGFRSRRMPQSHTISDDGVFECQDA
jgi:hypothetical protein